MMILSRWFLAFIITVISVFSNPLIAALCPAVFPDVIATHGTQEVDSNITFGRAAQVKNNPDTILTTRAIQFTSTPFFPTCDSIECTASNTSSATSNPAFDENNSSQDVSVIDGGSITFGIRGLNKYRNVNINIIDTNADPKPVPNFATLNFGSGYDSYHFKQFNLGVNTTLNLLAGKSYFFEELTIQEATTINVVGDGTAIVYVKKALTFPADTQVNSPIKASGDVTKLVMHVDNNTVLKSGVTFSGALYARDLTYTSASFLYGVSAGEKVIIEEGSLLTYDARVFDAEFGRVCGPEPEAIIPIANFKFDEKEYADVSGEVKDSIGTFHSRAKFSQPVEGKVCRAIDLSATGTSDYVVLDEAVLDGRSEFSISVWAKTAKTGAQSIVSGATSGSNNELLMWFTNATRFRPYLQNTQNGTLPISSIAGDTWRHLVWTHGNNQSCLFIDKVPQGCLNQTTRVLSIQSLILGQEQDSVGGRFSAAQAYNGLLDELVIFDKVIEQSQIDQIYEFQDNGLGLDGEPISCGNDPILQYSMEALLWNGSQGEVIDETGNYNTKAENGVTTANQAPALIGNPGTCRYGDFDGVDDFIQINDDPVLDLQKELSVSVWINPKTLPQSDLKTIVSKDENYEFHLNSSGEILWWWQTQSFTTSGAGITAGNWYHISITYKSGKQVIYVNGVEKGSRTHTGDLILNNDPLQIGQDQGIQSRFFSGYIDEVFIFDNALSSTEVNAIYNMRHACAEPVIHHYEIVHDGNGLTCDAEAITIKACTNSNCSVESTESVSLNFNIISPTTGTTIKATPTFTGSTIVNLSHTIAETVTLTIDDASIAASNAVECSGFGSSCEMTFADAGFRFLYDDNNSETIAPQTAGVEFNEVLKLQAVKNNNGVCAGIFNGNVNMSLSQQNITPDLAFNAGLAFQTGGDNIAKHPQYSDNVILDFGNDSIAIIPSPRYLDAGKIRLNARYTSGSIAIVGSSNDFWVKPANFDISASYLSAPLNGNTALSTTTHKAGENFNLSVKALNFDGQPTQNYRQSDGQLQLKVTRTAPVLNSTVDGIFTYAAGQNITTSTNANFQDASLTSFTEGDKGESFFNAAQFNEVGIINLDIQDVNYGGLGSTQGLVSALAVSVGRFTPAYFKQSVKEEHTGRLDNFHSTIGSCAIADWAYSGQKTSDNKGTISYSIEPKITITAYNAQNEVTQNYTLGEPENFMKLLASGVDTIAPTNDDVQQVVDSVAGNPVGITSAMEIGTLSASIDDEGEFNAGEWLYTFSVNDHFSYDHNDTSLLQPFGAIIPLVTAQVEDSDGILLSTDTGSAEKLLIEGVEIRFARMVLENSYGSEKSQLRAPLNIEIYDGTNFITHSAESCLTTLIADKKSGAKYSGNMDLWDYRLIDIDTDAIQVGDTTASVSGIFELGIQNQLLFSRPDKQGMLEWEYEVPDWFKFKWDALDTGSDNNFYDDNPSALLSFGIYRGNDRIISWQEVEK